MTLDDFAKLKPGDVVVNAVGNQLTIASSTPCHKVTISSGSRYYSNDKYDMEQIVTWRKVPADLKAEDFHYYSGSLAWTTGGTEVIRFFPTTKEFSHGVSASTYPSFAECLEALNKSRRGA